MMTIRLYGPLGEQFGRVWRFDVRSPAEAVRAMCSQLPGFRRHLQDNRSAAYRVLADTEVRGERELALPTSARTLRFVPLVQGAGGLGKVVLGAALIWAAGPLGEWLAFDMMAGATATSLITGAMTSIGWSMVIGGVSQALTKSPSTSNESVERPDNKPSYAFDGAVNTAAQGNPVPVCYGQLIVGSQVISAGLSTEQVAA